MRGNVTKMTTELEQRIRKIVTAKTVVKNVANVLREFDANLSNGQGTIALTQSMFGASQLREKQRRSNVNLSDEEDKKSRSTARPLRVFKQKINNFHFEYENSFMRYR